MLCGVFAGRVHFAFSSRQLVNPRRCLLSISYHLVDGLPGPDINMCGCLRSVCQPNVTSHFPLITANQSGMQLDFGGMTIFPDVQVRPSECMAGDMCQLKAQSRDDVALVSDGLVYAFITVRNG